jgi:hypothetical protein
VLLRKFLGVDVEHEVHVANRWSPYLLVVGIYASGS